MKNKERLELILRGEVPEVPPTFEFVFALTDEFFGIKYPDLRESSYTSTPAYRQALNGYYLKNNIKLIEELGYAAVTAPYYEDRIDRIQSLRFMKRELGSQAVLWSWCDDGVFWMPTGDEIMEFVSRMCLRPDEMHAEARKKCETAKRRLTQQADAGVELIIHNTDFGFNTGPFISPPQFEEFIVPYMRELVEHIHRLGMSVFLHSDGDIRLLLDMIHAAGFDGYHSVDPQGHMDIKEVRNRYPDWILMGNVACNMLHDGDEIRIRESVRYCMEHGGIGKKYIFSTSNTVFSGMPPESYRVMLDEYQSFCREASGAIN